LDHLLEWSGDHALFLLVLSRPDGTEREGLGLLRRSVTTLSLDPLSDEFIGEMLDGLVAGLPAAARTRIVERAEGIPLSAIETVRGLVDKGVLEKGDDGALRLTGELGELETPPGLTALIASRLDGLGPDERRLVKECSVLGASFPRQAIEAVSDIDPSDLDELLSSLVRKEVLTVRADRLSPERGQYVFTQSLIRSVAYDMLTRSERKTRHLRTSEHLRAAFPDDGAEVSEVIAAHLYEAYLAAKDDADSGELRVLAREAYGRAAERADSVGAPEAAESAFLRAAELSSNEEEQAAFAYLAGRMAVAAGQNERSIGNFETAIALHASAGRVVDAAQVTAQLGFALDQLGRGEQAITRIREALTSLEGIPAPPEVIADLQSRLGRALVFSGHGDEASGPIEEALTLAQHHELAEPLAFSLSSRAALLGFAGRGEEARLNLEGVLAVARRHGITEREMVAEANLADLYMTRDIPGAEAHALAALSLARRWGLRRYEALAALNFMYILSMAGRFEEAHQLGTELLQAGGADRPGAMEIKFALACLEALRGDVDAARGFLAGFHAWTESDDVQDRSDYACAEAAVSFAGRDSSNALEAARRAIREATEGGLAVSHESVRIAFPVALDAALELGELGEVERMAGLLAARPRGEVPPFLRAQVTRAKALIASARGEDEVVEEHLAFAEATFRDLGYPYWTARVQLDKADWLVRQNRLDESRNLATEAAVTFEAIGAKSMLARSRAIFEGMAIQSDNGAELQASS